MAQASGLDWFEELPCSVTVCDKKYKILYMNDKAAEVSSKDGGKALIGKNLLDCHPSKARARLRKVMASGLPNVYTIEKGNKKKFVYQCHWKKAGKVAGLAEFSFELPPEIPNLVRD
jgi:transcriptional regulator with PAS, ATPase and Fis domain